MARKTVHTIYGLYDPEDTDQEIRYVGYTHFSPELRIIDHVAGAKKHADTHKQKWIRKLLRKNVRPAFKVLEITTAKNWKQRERHWIAALREQGNRLTNSTEGGEGLVNPSKDVRKRISEKVSAGLIGNQRRKGKPHRPEIVAQFIATRKTSKKWKVAWRRRRGQPGHPMSEANKEALRAATIGRARPDNAPRLRKQAKKNRGSFWVNDGMTNQLMRFGESKPKGFKRGRLLVGRPHSEESKLKLSLARRGKPGPTISRKGRRKLSELKRNSRWITNGVQRRTIQIGEALPPGWYYGRKLVA